MVLVGLGYLTLIFSAPRAPSPNPYHFSTVFIVLLSLTIVGLLYLLWFFGLYAWLRLDQYAQKLQPGEERRAYRQIAGGIKYLTLSVILSSFVSGIQPFFRGHSNTLAVANQINFYILVGVPFIGFLVLQKGTKHLADLARNPIKLSSKFGIIAPPIFILGGFYLFLAFTNSSPGPGTPSGPVGTALLYVGSLLVIGSWVLGLLAALNIERYTHNGDTPNHAKPFIRLYNGVLLTTCGFIILHALLSLGTTRLENLPIGLLLLLIYLFIGVVALGFLTVGLGAGRLATISHRSEN